MEKKVLIFGHTDLDGIGVQIIGIKRAESLGLPYEVFKCNYSEVNHIVRKVLSTHNPYEIEEVLIGDISVNEEVAQALSKMRENGVRVVLRDHHATAEWLNKYPWAYVAEKEEGIPFCGTYLLAKEFPDIFTEMSVFIETVDSWDTWKWKDTNNEDAKKLNSLFQIMSTQEFIDYILNLDMKDVSQPSELFNAYTDALIAAYNSLVIKSAKTCESSMWTANFQFPEHDNITLKGGIIFCNSFTSNIADYILTAHPELDFLMIGNLPRTLSFRTQKELPIPLGDVAKYMTGSGGGHPQSAGAGISCIQFKRTFKDFMKVLNKNTVKVTGLEISQ